MQEEAQRLSETQVYLAWLDFVKPRLHNMIKVLRAQYEEDGAPKAWMEWSLAKTATLAENDWALVAFVEVFLPKFWIPDEEHDWKPFFNKQEFEAARNESLKELVKRGEIPAGVDLSYDPSPVAKEKIGLYMAMLCDSHDVMVKNKLNSIYFLGSFSGLSASSSSTMVIPFTLRLPRLLNLV